MHDPELLSFGALLRQHRLTRGWTQEDLAERARVSVQAVSTLERGTRRAPRLTTARELASALDLSEDERAAFFAVVHGVGNRTRDKHPSPTNAVDVMPTDPLRIEDPLTEAQSELRVFMFVDMRGYTPFTQDRGDEAAARLSAKIAAVAREGVAAAGGEVIELRGDEVLAVFMSARQALHGAVDLQRRLAEQSDSNLPLTCGIGLDAGEAIPFEGGYRGGALNLGARLCSLAAPGEVLASEGVIHLARKTDGLKYVERGMVHLKGFADPVRVMHVMSESDWTESVTDQAQSAAPMPIGGFLGALPAEVLVARQSEFVAVLKAVDSVVGGAGRLVFLAGEPGVGKTRVAQEVTLALRHRGFLTGCGRCYEPQWSTPYYPFLEALATVYAGAPPTIRATAIRRWPHLGRLLPDGTDPLPVATLDGQNEQQRLFAAVTAFLIELARTTPIALLLDDLHWADGASLELLQHLARHTRAYPVFLLGTFRELEGQRRQHLKRALLDLNREHLVERIAISRLGQEETAALVAASLGETETPAEFASLVHRHTDGNPFFIQEVLRALVERGQVYRRNDGWEQEDVQTIKVPESVKAAIDERVSRLAQETQTILSDASVLGQTFTFDEIQALEARPESELERALDEATHDGLVRETSGDCYAFNHALTQQALYMDLSTHRRRRLHLASGEVLEALPESVRARRAPELAWHFLEGGDQSRAFSYSVLSGDQASAVFAYGEAEQFYKQALKLSDAVEGSTNAALESTRLLAQADILQKTGMVLKKSARYGEALTFLERSAVAYEAAGGLENVLGVIAQIGSVHHVQGTWAEGIARVQSVLAPLQERRDRGMQLSRGEAIYEAAIYISLAHLSMKEGKYDASLAATVRASELAREVGDNRILAQIEAVRGDALRLLGKPAEALVVLEHSLELTETLQDDDTLFLALDSLAEMYLLNGDLQRCKDRRERAVEVAERTGDGAKVAFETTSLGYASFYIGNWESAVQHFEKALHLARSLGLRLTSAHALFGLGMEKLAEGQWDAARRHLEEGTNICETLNNVESLSIGSGSFAELELLEGQPQLARERLEELLKRPGLSKPAISSVLPILAWGFLEIGDQLNAEKLVVRAMEEATEQQNKLALLEALKVRGMLLARQRCWEDAAGVLGEAVSMGRAMPFPHNVARILTEIGDMDLRRGNVEKARSHLNEAVYIFHRLGALKDEERTMAILGRVSLGVES